MLFAESTGDAVLSANSIAVKAPFYILSGGELTVITVSAPVSVDPQAINVLPENFIVRQNYPNPFNPITHISYDLPKTMNVEIVIYNVSGQIVNRLLSIEQSAGSYTVTWDGTDNTGALVSSAIYYYRIKAGRNIISRKMTFIK